MGRSKNLSKTLIVAVVAISLTSCNRFKELAGLDIPKDPTVSVNSMGLWEGQTAAGQLVFLVLTQTGNDVAGRIGGVVKGNSSYGTATGDTVAIEFGGTCVGSVVTGSIKEPVWVARVVLPCIGLDETIVLSLDR